MAMEVSIEAGARRIISYFEFGHHQAIDLDPSETKVSDHTRQFLVQADRNRDDKVDLAEMKTAISRWDGDDNDALTYDGFDPSRSATGGWASAVRAVFGLADDARIPLYFDPIRGGTRGVSGGPGRNGRPFRPAEWARL